MYVSLGFLKDGSKLFDEMPERNLAYFGRAPEMLLLPKFFQLVKSSLFFNFIEEELQSFLSSTHSDGVTMFFVLLIVQMDGFLVSAEERDRTNAACKHLTLSGCTEGTPIYRTPFSVTNGLGGKKIKEASDGVPRTEAENDGQVYLLRKVFELYSKRCPMILVVFSALKVLVSGLGCDYSWFFYAFLQCI
ncbi:hypothetical protein WN943_016468 [Citrus x changshan-huyou]